MSTRHKLVSLTLAAAAALGFGCTTQAAPVGAGSGARAHGMPNAPTTGPHDRPGFVTFEQDGRLWVFAKGSKELDQHLLGRELAKNVTRIGAGPAGMSLRAPDAETINGYLAAKPGFVTLIEDGRVWVFEEGSPNIDKHAKGLLAKHVSRIGAGPGGMTVRAADAKIIDAYLAAKPGFVTFIEDGRVWVFSPEIKDMENLVQNLPAKHITRIGAGPGGMTVKGTDADIISRYLAAPGY